MSKEKLSDTYYREKTSGPQQSTEFPFDNDRNKEKQSGRYVEVQYKKPKKTFVSEEEKRRFVQMYRSKEKTEMCKNWEMYAQCKYGNNCSFAHGPKEIRLRTDIRPIYKSKLCKQFTETGQCLYGKRCLFIHNHLTIEEQKNTSYIKMLKDNIEYIRARMGCLGERNDELDESRIYVSSYKRRRLGVFASLPDESDKSNMY